MVRSEGREELGGCSEGREELTPLLEFRFCSGRTQRLLVRLEDVEIPVSQFPISVIAIVCVCFLNSSEVGSLGSGRGWSLVCLLGKNSAVAWKVDRFGRFMDVEIPVSQFPLSVIAIFIYRVLIWLVFFIFFIFKEN